MTALLRRALAYMCACWDCMTCALGQHCGQCRANNNNRNGGK